MDGRGVGPAEPASAAAAARLLAGWLLLLPCCARRALLVCFRYAANAVMNFSAGTSLTLLGRYSASAMVPCRQAEEARGEQRQP